MPKRTQLLRRPSFGPGIGLQVQPPESIRVRRVSADALRASSIDDTPPTDGQVLRFRMASRSYEPEASLVIATDNVSSPPTDAELDTAFGQASVLGDGFIGVLDDNGAGTTVWLCIAMNSAWWYEQLTKAV